MINAQGARSLAAALDTNRVLQFLKQDGNNIAADIKNLVADRLRVNKLILTVALWVASAAARRVELWDDASYRPPTCSCRPSRPPACSRCSRSRAGVRRQAAGPRAARRFRLAVAAAGGTYFRGCLPATCCRAPRPRCARSCSGWPTPPSQRALLRACSRAAFARSDGS